LSSTTVYINPFYVDILPKCLHKAWNLVSFRSYAGILSPTIYAIANAQTWDEQLFNGFKWDMNAAYASFARRAGDCPLPALRAYTEGEQDMPEHQLRELVGDLIGGYFSAKREPPRLQF